MNPELKGLIETHPVVRQFLHGKYNEAYTASLETLVCVLLKGTHPRVIACESCGLRRFVPPELMWTTCVCGHAFDPHTRETVGNEQKHTKEIVDNE